MKYKIRFFSVNTMFVMGILFSLISTLLNIVLPLIIRNAIDMRKLIENKMGIQVLLTIGSLLIASTLITAMGNFLVSREGDRLIADVRTKVQTHLMHLPTSFFDNNLSGQLASRVINDASILKNFVSVTIPANISSMFMVIGTLFVLVTLDLKMTILICFCFPLVFLIMVPIGKIIERYSIKSQTELSNLTETTTESLRNIRPVKLNHAEKGVLARFYRYIQNLYHISVKFDEVFSITNPIQTLVSYSIILTLILYGGARVTNGTMTLGTLVSFLIYFFQLTNPINSLAVFYSDYKQAIGATQKINEIMSIPTEDDNGLVISGRQEQNPLILKNVYFAYGQHEVLRNVSLRFEQQKKIAIVGPSGAGKTTIINILTRLYPIDKGELLLGKTPAYKYKLSSWRKLFSIVTQENSILSGSIKDNLLFGLDTKPNNTEINHALNVANLSSDISLMPRGISTIVGEQGVKLSGGQRQRLQIARTYLKQTPVIILDEATSSLDSDSEKNILTSLERLSKDRTVISIAHRLSTIVHSDLIYFVDDHRILACGTHKELLAKLPEYKRFVNEQKL